ncbi:MAG: hypothetical protein K940chlam3_01642 [Chlamydiae bacterium]|nr:hypothetical protein [Chlamydiota bacterium]
MKIKSLLIVMFFLLPAMISAVSQEECSQEVLFKFYPKGFVLEVLDKHDIPKGKAQKIADSLYEADQQVVMIIGQKASTMSPNPLEDIKADKERAQLFRDSLMEVFNDVMAQNGVTDNDDIKVMLDEIQQMRMQRFDQCRKQGLLPKMPSENIRN